MPRTIRVQIVMAFSVCFIFMGGIIAVSYVNFQRLTRSLHVLEAAEQLNSTILEMRRYEKNYLLFRQDLNFEENVTFTNQLALVLQRERDTLTEAIGPTNYGHFLRHTAEYGELMEELHRSACLSQDCDDLRARIRGTGQNLLLLADQLVTTERRAINRRTQELIPLPLLGLLVLVILMGFVVIFIGERVVRPLARITRESEAVAGGLLSTNHPVRRPEERDPGPGVGNQPDGDRA